jgi:putative ABC transport system permease protein
MICLAVIVAAGGFVTSIRYSLGERLQSSFHSDYLFIPPSITLWSNNIGANQSFAESLRKIEGVGDISSLRFSDSMLENNAVTVIGLDPDVFPRVSSLDFSVGDDTAYQKMKEGRYMAVNQIFIITTGHKVGDTVNLASTNGVQPYQIVAVGGDLMNTKTVSVYLSQANLERDFNASDDFFIQLNLLPGADAEKVDQQIVQTAANYPQFTIIRGKVFLASFMAQIQAAFVGLYFLLALLALPSLVAMLNTLAISVIERTREIGMLRAVGATRKQIRSMITLEAVLLALIGTTFGILSGLYLGVVFVDATNQMLSVVYQFPVSGILAGLIIGVVFGILAAIIPARQAARLNVVQALRYE